MTSRSRRGIGREWPLLIFVTALQSAAGLALTVAVGRTATEMAGTVRIAIVVVTSIGVAVSLLHLGRPLRAWRALLNVRHSSLSREVAATILFAGAGLASWMVNSIAADWLSAVAGVVAVVVSACVYVDEQERAFRRAFVIASFLGSTAAFALIALLALTPARRPSTLLPALLAAGFAVFACATHINAAVRRFGCKDVRQTT